MALLADQAELTNPFPGLRSFEPDEEHLFFGREQQVDELLSKLRQTRFLTVVGSSGSGKSSIVRSGLIPALFSGFMVGAGSGWRVAIARPGDDPIGNLAEVLASPEVLGRSEASTEVERSIAGATLRRGARGLVEVVRQARLPGDEKLLVLLDQFEEIFRFKRSEGQLDSADESAAFVKLLLEAASDEASPIYVVLTMRSDFLGNCSEFQGLPEAINRGLYLVPRMTREQRRAAICGPVAVAGNEMSQRLVLRLLNDVGDNPDQLPILQHALMRTWDFWERNHTEGEPLDLRHYEAIGTLDEAMSLHAEEAYAELGEARGVAEKLFKSLTEKGADGRGVRRPATLEEICEVGGFELDRAIEVIEAFRRPGRSFLVPPAGVPLTPDRVMDISHESLMRVWRRLAQWVDEESQGAHLYRRLAEAAARHQAGKGALWRDPELQLALTWQETTEPTAAWAQRYDPSFERAMTFLRLSREERDGEIDRREKRRRRQLLISRMVAIGSTIALAVIVVFAALARMAQLDAQRATLAAKAAEETAIVAKEEAEEAKEEAVDALDAARASERRAIASAEEARREFERAESERQRARRQERLAREQKEIADQQAQEAERQRELAQKEKERADKNLERAVEARTEAEELQRIELARNLATSQVRRLLEADEPELATILALQAFELGDRSQGSPALHEGLRLSADGLARAVAADLSAAGEQSDAADRLAAALAVLDAGRDRLLAATTVRERGAEVAVGVRAMAVVDGIPVWGREDGVVEALPVGVSPGEPRRLAPAGPAVWSLLELPGSRDLVVGDADGGLRIVSIERDGGESRLLSDGPGVQALALSADGELAAGLENGSIRRWRRGSDGSFTELAGWTAAAGVRLRALAYLAGGGLVTGGDDGVVRRWRAGELVASIDLGAGVTALAALGDELAIGTFEGRILTWGATETARVELFGGHLSAVNQLIVVRPEGSGDLLVSASSDGEVLLWPVDLVPAGDDGSEGEMASQSGRQPIELQGHAGWVWTVAATDDGRKLFSGASDGTVWSWATRAADLATTLCSSKIDRLAERDWRMSPEEWQRNVESLDYENQKPLCDRQ